MINKIIEGIYRSSRLFGTIFISTQLGFEEFRTSDLVADYLSSWGYEVHRGLAGTGMVGTLRAGDGVKASGSRRYVWLADRGEHWQTLEQQRGQPHARLRPRRPYHHAARRRLYPGAYAQLQRHAAPDFPTGGRDAERRRARMVEQGAVRALPCDAIFAMHNMPGMPLGEFFFQHGPFVASMDQFNVRVQGGVAATAPSRS